MPKFPLLPPAKFKEQSKWATWAKRQRAQRCPAGIADKMATQSLLGEAQMRQLGGQRIGEGQKIGPRSWENPNTCGRWTNLFCRNKNTWPENLRSRNVSHTTGRPWRSLHHEFEKNPKIGQCKNQIEDYDRVVITYYFQKPLKRTTLYETTGKEEMGCWSFHKGVWLRICLIADPSGNGQWQACFFLCGDLVLSPRRLRDSHKLQHLIRSVHGMDISLRLVYHRW